MGETNRVVVRYLDGRVSKGMTEDFFPNRPSFHLRPVGSGPAEDIHCRELKAVFFVRDFTGNAQRKDQAGYDACPIEVSKGRKIAVRFKDGELMCGYTLAYTPERSGFFIIPADPGSNNLRVYVLTHATQEVGVGAKADLMLQRGRGAQAA